METKTIWQKDHHFESFQKEGRVEIDGDTGYSPKALLLAGLAGCTGIDLVDILTKMRVTFTTIQIDASAEQTTENPKVFKFINLTYRLHTSEENRPKIKKAIDLSLDSYCGVAAMLKKTCDIHYEILITDID